MISRALFRNIFKSPRSLTTKICNFSTDIDIEKLEKEPLEIEIDNEEARLREEEIQKKRNKSRLYSQHQNVVNGKLPHQQPQIWQHETLKYKRRMYGIYGNESGMNPSMCWPTEQELAKSKYYEEVSVPNNILEVREDIMKKRAEEREVVRKRQEDIAMKLGKLDQWTQDLKNRIAKREAEVKAAKDRKDRIVEEVRRHFGYKVDPREDKFKELLEKKEKAEKKLMKEARRKAKDDKIVARMTDSKTDEKKENKGDPEEVEVKT